MEDAPCEAIKNNAIGTYKTVYAALPLGGLESARREGMLDKRRMKISQIVI